MTLLCLDINNSPKLGSSYSDEIYIVFDSNRKDRNYRIKNEERDRGAKSKEMVVLDVISPNQNVPVT